MQWHPDTFTEARLCERLYLVSSLRDPFFSGIAMGSVNPGFDFELVGNFMQFESRPRMSPL